MKVHRFGERKVLTAVGSYKGSPAIFIWNEKHNGEVGAPADSPPYREMSWFGRFWLRRKITILTFASPEMAAVVGAAIQCTPEIARGMVHRRGITVSGDSCSTCHFHRGFQCRKAPPVRLPRAFADNAAPGNRVRDETLFWGWPEVLPGDWCGAFEPKKGILDED